MHVLATVAIIIGAIAGVALAVVIALAMRQGWREGDVVEILGPDGMPVIDPQEGQRRAEFAEPR